MTHSDVSATTRAVVENLLGRLQAADAEGVGQLFADDIDWYVPGHPSLPWTGRRNRREQVAEYLETMWPHFVPGESKIELDKVVVEDGDAVVFSNFQHTVKANGRTFSTPTAIRLVVTGGEITKLELFEDTLAVSNAFFPDANSQDSDS
jgi:ketosteroid isomerase-like protein